VTISQKPNDYQHALSLAEAGKHEEALSLIQEYLLEHPKDGEALNDAGTILYVMGRFDEAAEHLKLALENLDDVPGETLWNLVEVYLASNRPAEALGLFDQLEEGELLNPDLANRTATALLDQDDLANSVEALIRSFDIAPDQKVLVPIYDRVKALRPRIAFFYDFNDFRFLKDIYKFLRPRFETRLFEGGSEEDMLAAMQWCDVAWFEWCANQLIAGSNFPKVCKIITRLHRFEAYAPWPQHVNWKNVDVLVTVGNDAVLEHLRRRFPKLEDTTRVVIVPNGVDLERFRFVERSRGKNLACVSRIHDVKNYPLLLQCFYKLHSIDAQYRLFIAGPYQDDGVLRGYLHTMIGELGLKGSVFFEGKVHDIPAWLEDKHYIVSASQIESQGMYILEGMARGLKPVIHTWPGCRSVYPEEYLFRTVDEFCEQILEGPYTPKAYSDFVAEKYSLEKALRGVNELFLEIEKEMPRRVFGASGPQAPVVVEESSGTAEEIQKVMELNQQDIPE
jgi:glycosyltransferase involved in cell wall biosynthesis